MNKKIEAFDVFVYTAITLVTLIVLYPIVNVIAVSLSDYAEYIKNPLMIIPRKFNIDAYIYVFQQPFLLKCYGNTIFVTAVYVALGLFLTITAAYPLSKQHLRGRAFFMNTIIFTMLFNGGLIPNYYLIKELGLYNSLWALICMGLVSAFNVILMKNFIEGLPQSIDEAARIDGAGELLILFRIVVPLSTPIIFTLGMFMAVYQWNSFFNSIVYISERGNWTLQLMLREIINTSSITTLMGDTAQSSKMIMPETIKYASLIVVMLPIICVYPFIQKYFVKGIMLGAVKG